MLPNNQAGPEVLQLKQKLHDALGQLQPFQQCVLLDHPDHTNVGDSMIWCGEVLYLSRVLKAKISYAASIRNFSEENLNEQDDNIPILLHGGGNFGDIWAGSQDFRNYIVSKYRKRPIVIFPQTIYFADSAKLAESAKIFNAHPDLTIFVRDHFSYEIASQNFQNCRVIRSPDAALEMIGVEAFSNNFSKKRDRILYHCREDQELNLRFSSDHASFSNLNVTVKDWTTQKYHSQFYKNLPQNWIAQRSARILQGIQDGNLFPIEWTQRQYWKLLYPSGTEFNQLHRSAIHRASWGYVHQGIYQFKQYRLVVTNRLHGHILCILMGIPHVFLPNSYYKNENFYKCWTQQIPFCRFVTDSSKIEIAAQELLELY